MSEHGRTCIGEHLTLCVEKDGHLLAFPDNEHPELVLRGFKALIRVLAENPSEIYCLVGAQRSCE